MARGLGSREREAVERGERRLRLGRERTEVWRAALAAATGRERGREGAEGVGRVLGAQDGVVEGDGGHGLRRIVQLGGSLGRWWESARAGRTYARRMLTARRSRQTGPPPPHANSPVPVGFTRDKSAGRGREDS